MALSKLGFIVTGFGYSAEGSRAELSSPTFNMLVVGVERPEQGVEAARWLAAQGVQLIELCGGFGPVWTARVIEVVGGIPVGAVAYGAEALPALHALIS